MLSVGVSATPLSPAAIGFIEGQKLSRRPTIDFLFSEGVRSVILNASRIVVGSTGRYLLAITNADTPPCLATRVCV